MKYTIQQADIEMLRKNAVSDDDITHSVHVAEKALEIARRIDGNGLLPRTRPRRALFW